jgi:hypothetical protein
VSEGGADVAVSKHGAYFGWVRLTVILVAVVGAAVAVTRIFDGLEHRLEQAERDALNEQWRHEHGEPLGKRDLGAVAVTIDKAARTLQQTLKQPLELKGCKTKGKVTECRFYTREPDEVWEDDAAGNK